MPKDIQYCQSIDNKMLLSSLVYEKYLDKACEKFSRLYYRYLDIWANYFFFFFTKFSSPEPNTSSVARGGEL